MLRRTTAKTSARRRVDETCWNAQHKDYLFSESRFPMTSHHDARGELRASGDAALRIDRRASM